jgi:hypothetical protein
LGLRVRGLGFEVYGLRTARGVRHRRQSTAESEGAQRTYIASGVTIVGQNSFDIRRETFINHGFKVTCLSFKGLWISGPGLRSKVRRYLEVSFKWEVVLSRSET